MDSAQARAFKNLMQRVFTNLLSAFSLVIETSAKDGAIHDYIVDLVTRGADENVYGAYGMIETGEPKVYKRRRAAGGLTDPSNIVVSYDDASGELNVKNIAPCMNTVGDLEEIILTGNGYDGRKPKDSFGNFRVPRNFYNVFEEEFSGAQMIGLIRDDLQEKVVEITLWAASEFDKIMDNNGKRG